MKDLRLSPLVIAAALLLCGCITEVAPALYVHRVDEHYHWALYLLDDGKYSLEVPNRPTGVAQLYNVEAEHGTWRRDGNRIILSSDSGSVRTFSVHRNLGGHYLVEDGKDFPVLQWADHVPDQYWLE